MTIAGQTVFMAFYTIAIDGIEHERLESINASREGANGALAELRDSPMWERQGLETWVDEWKIDP